MNAVDTNMLVYAHDPRDPVKQNKAAALTASLTDGFLRWQVACERYIAANRKLAPFGLNLEQAYADLKQLCGAGS
jgi:predicted nucleic acid-binding protein